MSLVTVADLMRELTQWDGSRIVQVEIEPIGGGIDDQFGFSEAVKVFSMGKNARETSEGARDIVRLYFTADSADIYP